LLTQGRACFILIVEVEKNLGDQIMTKPNSKEIALEIKSTCNRLGWTYEARATILVIRKSFDSTKEAFVVADSEYYGILSLIPSTSAGSIWGTDGGGCGALAAIKSGVFEMKKSGCSKRVLNALNKLDTI
jgi:hypothetical protein